MLAEAFACDLPVVATDVGGVRGGVDQAALLVPPGDARAAADAVSLIARDGDLRARLTEAGRRPRSELTLEAQTARLAAFLEAARRR